MTESITDFSAKEPSLGYFYQIKYALFVLLMSSKELDQPKIRIENLDDIEIETLNTLHLLQTKYHIKSKANLTDASVDFWKTIRIWSEHINNGLVDVDNTIFNLITTETVSETSLLMSFKETILSESELIELIGKLDKISLESSNNTNAKAYKAFQKLSITDKKKLIKNIRISDSSLDIDGVNEKIKKELIFSTYPSHLDAFLEILEGWWFKKSIDNLTGTIEFIDSVELQLKIVNIADSFKSDNLPNHFPEQLEVSNEDVDLVKEKMFMKQLSLIEVEASSRTVKRAISDFRRAFEQRSKWLRLHLLNPDEEEEYDRRLTDYWQNIFDIMCDEAEARGSSEYKLLGNQFYMEQFAKTCPQIKIREKFIEEYLTRGSYQILSDSKKIGWHPKYKDEV
ncbi:MAG TPA: ABC-three component system protein [Pedobacter sp.]|uniref:ABC-three component system protein n=1 Tax=Pedobacter sp. TaxID=1411316 RepID=UPI002D010E09|nr:ABC-three component system protein [Pedobacter sp.]HMI02394.1 ABC-three component system protein [Pedobacter sp.]